MPAALFLIATLTGPGSACAAEPLNQAEALAAASARARAGSDESLQNSTTSAMQAMLELNNQNRPGAIRQGYKSFGEYRTSEDLDIVRMKNRIRQIDLFTSTLTVNTRIPDWARKRENFYTSYARLDPKFLRHGEAARVAEEFERKSGMKRELFLQHLAKASEGGIQASDPNVTGKVLDRFLSFVDQIPNEQFRENVKREVEATSEVSRFTLIRDGVERVYEVLASYGMKTGQPKLLPELPAGSGPAVSVPESSPTRGAERNPMAFTGELPAKEDSSSRQSFSSYMAPRDAEFRGLASESFANDALGSVMKTALEQQKEASIFQQISRRYRAVAPALGPGVARR